MPQVVKYKKVYVDSSIQTEEKVVRGDSDQILFFLSVIESTNKKQPKTDAYNREWYAEEVVLKEG